MKVWTLGMGMALTACFCFQGTPIFGQTDLQEFEKIAARINFLIQEEDMADSLDIYLDQAHLIGKGANTFHTYAPTFIDFGRMLIQAGMPQKAVRRLYQLRQDLEKNAPDSLNLINRVRYEHARALYYNGQYEDCIDQLKSNLEFMEDHGLTENDHTQINLLGNAYRRVNNPLEAIYEYEQALDIRIDLFGPNANLVAGTYNNLGNAYSDLGIFNRALDYYETSLDIRIPLLGEEHSLVVGVMMNTAILFYEKGELQKARKIMNKVKQVFLKNEMEGTPELARLYINLGALLRQTGALDESLDHYLEAQSIYNKMAGTAPLPEQALILNNIANVYSSKGNHPLAVDYQLQAIDMAKTVFGPEDLEVARYYSNLGLEYQLGKNYENSIEVHKKAIAILADKPEFKSDLANFRNNLADVYLSAGQYQLALATNQKAFEDQLTLLGKKHPQVAFTYNKMALAYLHLGNKASALESVQKALIANHLDFNSMDFSQNPGNEGAFLPDYLFESLLLKAQLLPDQSPSLFHLADALLDKQRANLVSRDDQINLARQAKQLSTQAIHYWTKQYEKEAKKEYLGQMYYHMERSKANVLLNTLAQSQAIQFSGVPDSLIELEQKLQSDIQYFTQKLAMQPDSLRSRLYQKELFDARQSYNALVASLSEQYPDYHNLKHKNYIVSLDSIQQKLSSDAALLSYFLTDTSAFVMKITTEGIDLKKLEVKENYQEDLLGMKKSIYYRLEEDYLQLASDHFDLLLPFDFGPSIDQLIISPDGVLTNIPFGALLTKKLDDGLPEYKELPYLIRNYSISYTPSASLLNWETGKSIPSEGGLVAFAPIFNDIILPDAYLEKGNEILVQRGRSVKGAYTAPLPGTEIEVSGISEIFKRAGLSNRTYLYNFASEAQLKDESLANAAYLHIASHGFVNEDQPYLSGIQLYPVEGEEDNILFAGEVYNLNLNTRLLVLSACETGLGKEASGEGLLGFSRAFRYAGAQNLIVSQWKVEDKATSQLMIAFYENHLLQSANQNNFGRPLRQAKLKLIQSNSFSHPYFWAGMVLIGQ